MTKIEIPCAIRIKHEKALQKEREVNEAEAAEKAAALAEGRAPKKPSKKVRPPECPPPPAPPKIVNHEKLINQKNRKQPPVLITQARFQKIYGRATNADLARAAQERAEDEAYRQYLKKGSDDLVKNFGGNFARTQEQKRRENELAAEQRNKKSKTRVLILLIFSLFSIFNFCFFFFKFFSPRKF